MRDFRRRFRIAFDKFIIEVLAPGMIGLTPMLLPLQDPVPMDYYLAEDGRRRPFPGVQIPRQRTVPVIPWRPAWTPGMDADQN